MTEILQMPTATGDGLELKRYGDFIFPNLDMIYDPKRGMNYAREFKYKVGDIIICSYPKCGTNWLRNIIWKMKTFDNSKRSNDTVLEYGPSEIFETMETPRIINTHLKPIHLPVEHLQNNGNIVLILRNPKDAMVSYYHHLKNAVLFKNKQTWDEYFQSYIDGLVPLGSYFDYVQQWEEFLEKKSHNGHIELFYYEELKTNFDDNITRLNKFLGFNRDQQYLERVKEQTTLSALREQDAAGKRGTHDDVKDENGDSVIYRKGEVGDWKNYLSVAQSELVDKMMEERLHRGIIKLRYEI